MPKFIGARVPRREDRRLITGTGRYTDDARMPNAAYAHVVRSPYAHARVGAIRTAEALAAPGVLAVLTAADFAGDGHGPIAHLPNPADAIDWQRPAFVARDGQPPVADIAQPPLASERVRFAGEGVVMVVAASAAQARDAAELVDVSYDELPAVARPEDALALGAPQLWDAVPGNLCFDLSFGDEAATERAFDGAYLVLEREFDNQRLASAHMEPRAALASYDAATGSYTVIAGSQGVMKYRSTLAASLGVPVERVHVTSPDVGGGFGTRSSLHPEVLLVAWAARRVGRPVRWTADRSEAFLTDYAGRDISERIALAFDRDGRIRGLRATLTANAGAYTVGYAPLHNAYRITPGVYDIPAARVRLRAALTNTTPVTVYRGAGRPEATFALERMLDIAAPRLGLDRIELRRRNVLRAGQLPYRSAAGLTYDSGDFSGNMERALELADWDGFAVRRLESDARGLRRGIGFANYIEAPVGATVERLVLRVRPDRIVEISTGTQSSGQGHETTFAQVAAELLGVPLESIRFATGDSDAITTGAGTHSDRSMRIVGTLLVDTSAEIVRCARVAVAERNGTPLDAVTFDDGIVRDARTGETCDLFAVAAAAGAPLVAEADFRGRIPAHPTGCAVCELEIDPLTGTVTIVRYTQVDDCGRPINPLILDGQTHGGIAMGIGQALYEQLPIDDEGQVRGASFMEYAAPRAHQVPHFDVELREDPTSTNPLRVKGGGEGGTTPAPAAIVNAICDALRRDGVEHISTPATPEKIWRAIRAHGAEPLEVRVAETAGSR